MKTKIFLVFALIAGVAGVMAYNGGAAAQGGIDGTGASGSSGCSCHSRASTDGPVVELDSAGVAVTHYIPGGSYNVKLSGANGSTSTLKYFGFQLAAVKATGAGTGSCADAGTWGALPASVQNSSPSNTGLPETIIEQSRRVNATAGTGGSGTTYVISIPWTAPVAGTGSVKLYGVLNEVNGSGSGGDKYQVPTAVTITEGTSSSPLAGVHIAITAGSNPTCSGSSVTYTATPTNGGSMPSYQWKVNGTNAGSGSTFTTSTLTNGQSVTCVMASNLSGVTGSPATSNAITMTIHTAIVPSVSQAGSVLTASIGNSYQWLLNNGNITGATSQVYTATQNGSYSVAVTDANGCPATSSAVSVTGTAINEVTASLGLNIYPIPNQGDFMVNISAAIGTAQLDIYNENGQLVHRQPVNTGLQPVNAGRLSPGIYLIKVNSTGQMEMSKMIVVN